MENGFIVVLDSGIGGLSVLKELQKNVDNQTFIYYGDNFNAPYGNKTKKELLDLVVKNLLSLPFKIKAIILACNTLSVTIRKDLEQIFGVPVFGVFPPYQECLIKQNKTLLLATERTAIEIKKEIQTISSFYKKNCIEIIGLKSLAFDIERTFQNLTTANPISTTINLDVHFSGVNISENIAKTTIILGCTHYNLIENQIFNYFQPLKTISGIPYTIGALKGWLGKSIKCKIASKSQVIFFGKAKEINKKIYNKVVNASPF